MEDAFDEAFADEMAEEREMPGSALKALSPAPSPGPSATPAGAALATPRATPDSSTVRALFNDNPTDSLDLQHLVRTGQRTKVWRARWRDTGGQVTVKAIDVGGAALQLDLQDELRQEVDTLRNCRHRNLVSFYLSFVDEGRLWVVSDYHDAVSIRELLSSGLSECCIRYVVTAVAKALEYIHEMQKVHRYVKGANIVLDGEGVVRLGDFGVAEQLSTLTRNKATIGTPYWMAPEMVLRQREDGTLSTEAVYHAKSDVRPSVAPLPCPRFCWLLAHPMSLYRCAQVWSLGITVIEMAEVLPPWATALSPVRVLKEIAEGPPPTFSFTSPSRQLRDFATACLEKQLSSRLSSADCLQHEFLLNGEDAAEARAELLTRRAVYLEEEMEGRGDDGATSQQLGESIEVGGAGGSKADGAEAAHDGRKVSSGAQHGGLALDESIEPVEPLVVPESHWQPDSHASECPGCQRQFGLFLRKHHCRGCGQVFCNSCSRHYLQLATPPHSAFAFPGSAGATDSPASASSTAAAAADPQRTCEDCYRRLSAIEFSRSYDVFGPPSAPPIVWVHDVLCSRTAYQAQINAAFGKCQRCARCSLCPRAAPARCCSLTVCLRARLSSESPDHLCGLAGPRGPLQRSADDHQCHCRTENGHGQRGRACGGGVQGCVGRHRVGRVRCSDQHGSLPPHVLISRLPPLPRPPFCLPTPAAAAPRAAGTSASRLRSPTPSSSPACWSATPPWTTPRRAAPPAVRSPTGRWPPLSGGLAGRTARTWRRAACRGCSRGCTRQCRRLC
eukprot:COSAG05_NODE_1002_length_6238_cov_4.988597_3_plen_786_part_00